MSDEGPTPWEFGGTFQVLGNGPLLAEWYAYNRAWYSPTDIGSAEYRRRCYAAFWRRWNGGRK